MESLVRFDVVPFRESEVYQHRDGLLRHEDVGGSGKPIRRCENAKQAVSETHLMSLWTTPCLCRKSTPESRERNHGFECFSGTSTGTRRG